MSGSNEEGIREGVFPHDRVYTRLGPSNIHGVGVFAIKAIPEDTPVFCGDDAPLVWVPADLARSMPKEVRRLYEDFCVLKGEEYGCPENFNMLTPAWYVNHSDAPNVSCNEEFRFFALRDIEVGEELTADYTKYSSEDFDWIEVEDE